MNETQEILLSLIDHARTGEHTKFEQLRFFGEYAGARITGRATKRVVDILEESSVSLFNRYCKAVSNQQAEVNLLLAHKQLQQAVDFYKEELHIIKRILEDYENYLWDGNFLKAFIFGKERIL
jgi:hypothetical protein